MSIGGGGGAVGGGLAEEGAQGGLVEDRDAELAGLVELGTGLGAGHDEVGLLADAAAHLAAGLLDPVAGDLPGDGEGAGEDEGLAGDALDGADGLGRPGADAEGEQALDETGVPGVGEVAAYRLGRERDYFSDLRCAGTLCQLQQSQGAQDNSNLLDTAAQEPGKLSLMLRRNVKAQRWTTHTSSMRHNNST